EAGLVRLGRRSCRGGGSKGDTMAMAAVQAAERPDPGKVEALQGWRLAQEAASRSNRNLLQYGAGIAAILGIAAGSGGILAVANSLQKAQQGASAQLPGPLGALFV